jgi:hypothetical protein
MQFYTVLFGVSRAFGVAAQLIWDRALGARMCFIWHDYDFVSLHVPQLLSDQSLTQVLQLKKCSRIRTELQNTFTHRLHLSLAISELKHSMHGYLYYSNWNLNIFSRTREMTELS